MLFTKKTLALSIAIALPVTGLYSTNILAADEEATTTLPEVTVKAPRADDALPGRAVLDAAQLDAKRAATSDTATLIKDVPGVSFYGAGGVSSLPVIHGLADDRLHIQVDGMSLISACGNHMNPPLSYIDPSHVSTIQVFSGIAPVSSGGDSIGGTILVASPDPVFARAGEGLLTQGEIGGFYRSNGNVAGGNVAATLASEVLSMTYNGSTVESDNYTAGGDFKPAGLAAPGRDWIDADEVGSSMYKSTNQSLGFALRHDKHLVELKLGVQDIPYQAWPNQRMDMTGNDSEQINLNYEGDYGWGKLEARAYNEQTQHEMQFLDDKLYWYGPSAPASYADSGIPCTPGPTCAAGMPMETEGDNTGAVLKADISLSAGDVIRVGGEVQQYRLDDWWDPSGKGMWPNTFWNIRDGERDRLALFGEWEAQWNPQWLTQFGVRGEQVNMNTGDVQGYNTTSQQYLAESTAFNAADHEKTDNNIDLTLLARFTPDDSRSIEFGVAQKTRSPNLYERYTWSTGGMAMLMINMVGDGNGYVGNLDLEPEVAHTISATFDWHDATQDQWGLKVSPYYTHVSDYIDAERCSSANTNCGATNQTVTNAFVYLQFANQAADIYGLDVSGHLPLADDTAYGNFTASGVLSYVRGKNDTTGDNLYNMMPLNMKLSVIQRVAEWSNTAEVELVDDKTDVSATRNEIETESYGLLHLRASRTWEQVRFDLGIENVFDKLYSHPLSGAYTGQGITMPPVAGLVPWGVPVPGMGRSIYAGVNVKF